MSKPLTIVGLLKVVRDTPGTEGELAAHFHWSSSNSGQAATLSWMLGTLVDAKLVVRECEGRTPRYRIASHFGDIQSALGLSLTRLEDAQVHLKERERIQALMSRVGRCMVETAPITNDIISTLGEMRRCLEVLCYSSVVALSGRLLETSLKQHLVNEGVDAAEIRDLAIGRLLERCGATARYPQMRNYANVVKEVRNGTVHSKDAIPWPTMNTAPSVLSAVSEIFVVFLLEPCERRSSLQTPVESSARVRTPSAFGIVDAAPTLVPAATPLEPPTAPRAASPDRIADYVEDLDLAAMPKA